MLLPENMVRLQIITDKSNLNPIVTKLLKYGVFQPEDPLYPIGNGRIDEARKLITPVQDHISKVKIIMELGGLIIEPLGKMKVEDWIIASDQTNSEALKLEERYKELLEEIGRLRAERDLYLQQLKDLEPFKTITVELNTLYSSELFNVILA
ncbi:V-type ATP synthase subunit I, partial [Sulfolobus sp. C3]